MDMEGEGDEGLREEETMVGKEGSVLMGFYLGGQDTAHGPGQAHCPRWASLVAQSVKKSASNVGDLGSIPGSGRSPGSTRGNPAFQGTLGVASREPSTVSHFRTEHGTSLETL